MNICQDLLKEMLDYDPETGIFRWKVSTNYKIQIGKIAGTISDKGYVRIAINKKQYRAHRLAWLYMTGNFPKNNIDHVNHIRSDNRFNNLREATNTDNSRNRTLNKNNKSGVIGVCWRKDTMRWVAQIGLNGKVIDLGSYKDKKAAVMARKKAEKEYGFHENHGVENPAETGLP